MGYGDCPGLSVLGVGPGDPDLITVKALRLVREADYIFTPTSERKKESLAWEILKGALGDDLPRGEVIRQVYPMTRDRGELAAFWNKAAREIRDKLARGGRGVFITLGDPSLYSTWSYLRPRLDEKGVVWEIVPGVPSLFLGAALTGRELAIGEGRLSVIPIPADKEELEELASRFDTLVLMKIGRSMGRLKEMLEETGLTGRAWVVSRGGLPGQKVVPLGGLSREEEGMGYLSHVIIYVKDGNV